MTYRLVYSPEFKVMYRTLSSSDQQEVQCILDAIATCPEDGRVYQSMPDVLYRKVMSVDRRQWPAGIRVVYKVLAKQVTVACLDMGDHRTCGSALGQSIYVDERDRFRR